MAYYLDKDGNVKRTNEFGIFMVLFIFAAAAAIFALCASSGTVLNVRGYTQRLSVDLSQ